MSVTNKFYKYLFCEWTLYGRSYPRLDCWGLVCDIYKEHLGIELNLFETLNESNMTEGMEQYITDFEPLTKPEDYAVGCWLNGDSLMHCCVWYQNYIIHCDRRLNGAIEKASKYPGIKYFRYKGDK